VSVFAENVSAYARRCYSLISVLKICEKVYAMWLLYQNKNYSYCSCNPFIDNAPYWREWLRWTAKCLSVLVYWENCVSCYIVKCTRFVCFKHSASWHMWPLQATSCEAFLPQKIKTWTWTNFDKIHLNLFVWPFGRCLYEWKLFLNAALGSW
jgi:hypothetical protein